MEAEATAPKAETKSPVRGIVAMIVLAAGLCIGVTQGLKAHDKPAAAPVVLGSEWPMLPLEAASFDVMEARMQNCVDMLAPICSSLDTRKQIVFVVGTAVGRCMKAQAAAEKAASDRLGIAVESSGGVVWVRR